MIDRSRYYKRPKTVAYVLEFNERLATTKKPVEFSVAPNSYRSEVRYEQLPNGTYRSVKKRVAQGSDVILESLLFNPKRFGSDDRPKRSELYYAFKEPAAEHNVAVSIPNFYHLNSVAAFIGMQSGIRMDLLGEDEAAYLNHQMARSNVVSLDAYRSRKTAS